MDHQSSISGFFLAVVFSMISISTVGAAPKEGFPEPIVLDDQTLILNGTATRSVFGIGVYDAGLYVSGATDDGVSIMERNPDAKRLKIIMLRSVPEAKFASAVRDNLDRNLDPSEQAALAVELAVFFKAFDNGSDLNEGSEITIDYLPSEGAVVMVDGKRQAVIPGRDFYHAFLRLWIGKPLQASIKKGLLGSGKSR